MTDSTTLGKVLITGGGSGIGRAVAHRVAGSGYSVAILDRNIDAATVVAQEITAAHAGATAVAIAADISKEDEVRAAFAEAVDRLGGLTGVVASAAIQLAGLDSTIDQLDADVLDRTLLVNVRGTVLTAKWAARSLIEQGAGGSIVLVGSPTAIIGQTGSSAYATSKGAVHGLARAMAAELAPHQIRVNTVIPGFTNTPLVSTIMADHEATSALVSTIPLARPGEPDDAGAMIAFLLSDDLRYATGGFFTVDGGMTAV